MGKYDDIINTEWPRETLRPKMKLDLRAKIFLPFAALTGYEASLEQMRKWTEEEMEEKPGYINFEDEM